MSLKIIKQCGTHNMYSGARQIKYLVIHYTAGVTSKKGSARNIARYFDNPNAGASADYIVDDKEVVQYNPNPLYHSCWSVGGGRYNTKGGKLYRIATNRNCVNIEICSSNKYRKVMRPNDPSWYFTDAVIDNAVELAKYLMKKYNIPIDRVIRHYDCNAKPCPGIVGWNADTGSETEWKNFKARLVNNSTNKPSKKPTIVEKQPDVPFRYKVTTDLNIRRKASIFGKKTGYIARPGVYTIVETKGNWGKLKSGLGWISLNKKYGHKVN